MGRMMAVSAAQSAVRRNRIWGIVRSFNGFRLWNEIAEARFVRAPCADGMRERRRPVPFKGGQTFYTRDGSPGGTVYRTEALNARLRSRSFGPAVRSPPPMS